MNKNTKLLVLVLSLALMIGAVVGITAQAAESDPVILSQNVEYGGNYALMYAIKADSVKADEVTLAVYANAECTGEPLWDKTIAATAENQETVKDTACYVFTTAGIAAKQSTNESIQPKINISLPHKKTATHPPAHRQAICSCF